MLALIFLVGFLGFGIGVGGGPGGIFDALGISNSSNSAARRTAQFQDHIDNAQREAREEPEGHAGAPEAGARTSTCWARRASPRTRRPGRSQSPTTPTRSSGAAADAWSKYLKVNKGKPDTRTRPSNGQRLRDPQRRRRRGEDAGDHRPGPSRARQSYGQLAFFQYAGGDITGGDAVADKAFSMASGAQRKQLETHAEAGAVDRAIKVQKQQAEGNRSRAAAPRRRPAEPAPEPVRRRADDSRTDHSVDAPRAAPPAERCSLPSAPPGR